jgi:hypothetical protein
MPTVNPILNRYTSLPIALDVLFQKHITLLSPETWEDRNDAYYLEQYQIEMKFRSVLAICFSRGTETFHHWRVFSHGSAGVCIEFDKNKLLTGLPNTKEFRHQQVDYRWIHELEKTKPPIKSWPFLKRNPFKDEQEYRIVYETKTEKLRASSIPIDLSCIRKITLSPWLPESVAGSIGEVIHKIDDCENLSVNRSSLIDNAKWRAVIG